MAKTEPKDKALIIFEGTDALIQQAKEIILADSIGTEEEIKKLKDDYGALVIGGIKDMAGYKAVKEGISRLKGIRTSIEKRRKELTEPALKFQREVKAEADRIVAEIQPLEKRLMEQKSTIDDAIEAQRLELFQTRSKLLIENGYEIAGGFYICGVMQLSADQIPQMEDEEFDSYVAQGRAEIERRQAEEKRKAEEQDRLRKEREEFEREKREWAEQKAREKAELEAKALELNAQTNALETTYETVVQPEAPTPAPTMEQEDNAAKQSLMEAVTGKTFATAIPVVNPVAQKDAIETPEEKRPEVVALYMLGFDAFRMKVLAFVSDEETKLTRGLLKAWIVDLKP